MNNKQNKILSILVCCILSISMATALLQPANADTTFPDFNTAAFIAFSPSVIGVGQTGVINLWIQPQPQYPLGDAGNLPTLNKGFANITVTFTKPDGTKETFTPMDASLSNLGSDYLGWTESGGTMYFYYTPKAVGNWSVTCSFPGQTFTEPTNSNYTRYYKPCTSPAYYFTVQTEPVSAGIIDGSPYSPLPTEYWNSPVNINNREWAQISGDWIMSGYDNYANKYNPYSTAPKTAHVVWKTQQALGGLMGGDWGSTAYYGGQTVIVMNGKVYYNDPSGFTFRCLDLATGKVIFSNATGNVKQGIHFLSTYQVAAQQSQGVPTAYLVDTSTWKFYDPITGVQVQALTNYPSNIQTIWWQDGSQLAYLTQRQNFNTTTQLYGWEGIICWNYSKVTGNNWATGLVYNVSIGQNNNQLQVGAGRQSVALAVYQDASTIVVTATNAGTTFMGFNMTDGKWLWTTNTTYINDANYPGFGYGSPSGPYLTYDPVTGNFIGYDVKTGKQLWNETIASYPWGNIPAYWGITIDDMKYSPRYDGKITAVNTTSGKIAWVSDIVGNTTETVQGTWIFGGSAYANNGEPGAAADGMIYVSSQTNYRGEPMTRFNKLFCLNATTGDFLWNVTGAIAPTAIANGYLLGNNGDDGTLYCFGKGQTSTTINAPITEQQKGKSILITGSVSDLSPAQPNTPAVSDDSMTEWMNYIMQNNASLVNSPPKPNGVPVTLTAFDSNGNTQTIGTVETDSSGKYVIAWTPPITGIYTITASFEGTNSYWRSSAETAVNVVEPDATATPTPVTQSVSDMYFIPAVVSIIVAILVVGAIIALLVIKKRP